jgi:hypothetical protein
MSCLPSYSYTPTFVAGSTGCTLPVYNKHRARLFDGGTYFRSIAQGSSWNLTEISITKNGEDYTLTITHPGEDTETFTITQGSNIVDPLLPCTPGIAELRALVNHATTGSKIIEMYERGLDVEFDPAGEDDLCLSEFPPTAMTGGEGAPTDSATLATIRTGPSRSLIAIQTMEALDGTPVTPPTSERVQQWNGTAWAEYSNVVPGSCPV